MEKDGWPEFKLFDPKARLKQIAHSVGRLFMQLPEVPLAPSQYPKHPERLVAPVPPVDVFQPELPMQRGWPIIERPEAGQLQYSLRDRE